MKACLQLFLALLLSICAQAQGHDVEKIKAISSLLASIEFTVELSIETPKGNSTKYYSGETHGVVLPNSKLCVAPLSIMDRASYPAGSSPPGGTVTSRITKLEISQRGTTIAHIGFTKNLEANLLLIELRDNFPSNLKITTDKTPRLLDDLIEIGIAPKRYDNAATARKTQAISEPYGDEQFSFLSEASAGDIIINSNYEILGITTNHIIDSQPGRIGLLPTSVQLKAIEHQLVRNITFSLACIKFPK